MSSRSSWANATLRSAVTDVLNRVAGAANGAAMVRPLPARLRVFTIVATVVGIRLASCHGRKANLTRPPAAICSGPALPAPSTGSGGGHVGIDAAQLRQQVGAAHPVHRGVMDLGHHREQAAGARVGVGDTLDHPHLPQRLAAIQRRGCDVPADLGQFPAPSRRGQFDAEQMTIEVERIVVDPHRDSPD